MKTNECIKEVEAMGFEVEELNGEWSMIRYDSAGVARVNKLNPYIVDTVYSAFWVLDETKKQQLFKLLTEYASTPIEEREEEKKYMYRVKEVNGLKYGEYLLNTRYLNFRYENKEFFLSDNVECEEYSKAHFTHSELKSLGVDIEQLQEVYEEIEVAE